MDIKKPYLLIMFMFIRTVAFPQLEHTTKKDDLNLIGYAAILDIAFQKLGYSSRILTYTNYNTNKSTDHSKVDKKENLEFLPETEPEMPPVKIMGEIYNNINSFKIDSFILFNQISESYLLKNSLKYDNEFEKRRQIFAFQNIVKKERHNLDKQKNNSFNVLISNYDFFSKGFTFTRENNFDNYYLRDQIRDTDFNSLIKIDQYPVTEKIRDIFGADMIYIGFKPIQNWQSLQMSPANAEIFVNNLERKQNSQEAKNQWNSIRRSQLNIDYLIKRIIIVSQNVYLVEIDIQRKKVE